MNIKVDHLAFRVSDIDKIADMLKQLGYNEVRRTQHHGGSVELTSPLQPELVLEFTKCLDDKRGKPMTPGFDHCCFSIDENELNDLVANGFPTAGKPKLNPASGRKCESFRDNDDIKWQFVLNE